MPQSNIDALIALASFVATLLLSRVVARIQRGELPGGALWVMYLRTLVGFLLAAAIIYGYRTFFLPS
ncbi:MAG: flagellar biosynthesis protein FliR [Synergistaceae bacterium]|nr:flagellar biosynthesis protein FliR [Synergistaceae bacterium]